MSTQQPIVPWAPSSLHRTLYDRELGPPPRRHQTIRSIYGHRAFIDDLDIVNELSGHTGCVNALSWSKSGRLLASGSDDKYVNIYRYQPEDSFQQFSIATTISTGHSANIFSVKFMPHSNDRTLVSCAGDREVRVFDLEHSAASTTASTTDHAPFTRRARRTGAHYASDARFLTSGNTDCRVYRSHRERVKRIVTESSPHLFLTCSEDGEVRQWDLRQPSSAYPAGRFMDDDIPPPLISYRRYGLDLNTISCSPSQPHYIALGGAHLHCLLHDRRYLGRDLLNEAGRPGFNIRDDDSYADITGQATRCVRKFAPNGQQRMRRNDSGHITACKISDANPNEMIASWSGDGIYSFDLIRTPDAEDIQTERRIESEKKRKRPRASVSSMPEASERAEARQRTEDAQETLENGHEVALRVHYANGQIEDVPLQEQHARITPASSAPAAGETPASSQHDIVKIARRVMRLGPDLLERQTRTPSNKDGSTAFVSVFSSCASVLPEMRRIHASWVYQVDPSRSEIAEQRQLRSYRETCIRFVQAAGVCARVLGGGLHNANATESDLTLFDKVQVSSTEGPDLAAGEQFHVDFLKAIFLWLDSGIGSLLHGFSSDEAPSGKIRRFPVPPESDLDAIDEHLIPYLLQRAGDIPVINVNASRFEVDENHIVFTTEVEAVRQFAEAVKKPFADLSASAIAAPDESDAQDRVAALQFWGMTVARGILKTFSTAVRFDKIAQAFGGLGVTNHDLTSQELGGDGDASLLSDADMSMVDDEEEQSEGFEISEFLDGDTASEDGPEFSDDMIDDDNDTNDDDEETDEETDDTDEEEDSEDYDDDHGFSTNPFRSASARSAVRSQVAIEVPCAPHTRVYKGHCNVQTVKDVNFYGPNDEYVVSGSDDGNLFIWDRTTTKLVNILEGDGEVVNVVQGHPYEPMLAVSGIDDTIKIFSPDARARFAARLGSGVAAADPLTFSSVNWPSRAFGRRVSGQGPQQEATESNEQDTATDQALDVEADEFVAPNGLPSRKRIHQEYQITSQNDSRRTHGSIASAITIEDILSIFFRRGG